MIKPGSIRESHLSQQFELKHSKLQKADEGAQLLIAEDNPDVVNHLKFKPITIHGDGTLDGSGKLTVNFPKTSTTVISGDGLTDEQKQKLDGIEEGATRDKTGSEVKATYEKNPDTNAFTDTNKNQLDSTNASYLGNVANHVAQTSADSVTIPTDGSALNINTATTRRFPSKIYEAVPTVGSVTEFKIPHNFGYYPSVQVLADIDSCGDYEEIDAFVENGTTSTTIKTSEQGLTLKFILA